MKNLRCPDISLKRTAEDRVINGWLFSPKMKARMTTMTQIQSDQRMRPGMHNSTWNDGDVTVPLGEGHLKEALKLMELMSRWNIAAPISTYACLLKACTRTKALAEGKQLHDLIVQNGFHNNVPLGNTLINMYAKCECVSDARQVFDSMAQHDVCSWTSMMSAYTDHGRFDQAINLFNQMRQTEIAPNRVSFVVVLKACAAIQAIEQGKQIHMDIIQNSFEHDVVVANSLIDMYTKCGCIEHARYMFDTMPTRDVVSWNVMIAGLANQGSSTQALELYRHMKREGVQPNYVTYVIALKTCARVGALEQGKRLHLDIRQNGFESDVTISNTLLHMYAKCLRVDEARAVFDNMHQRSVVSWNAMIGGYAQHGHGKEALTLFEQMQRDGMKPDEATYVSVLYACSHCGVVEEGCSLFASMCKDHGIMPRMDHYACMVDLLGRAGRLADAMHFIDKMPIPPNVVVWMTLLAAARNHRHVKIGKRAFEYVMKLEPGKSAAYVLLSDIYESVGLKDEVAKLRKDMTDAGVKK